MHGTDFDKLNYIKICARNIVKFGSPTGKVVRVFLIDNSPPLKCNQSYQIRQNKTRNKTKPHQKSLLGHSLPKSDELCAFFPQKVGVARLHILFTLFPSKVGVARATPATPLTTGLLCTTYLFCAYLLTYVSTQF